MVQWVAEVQVRVRLKSEPESEGVLVGRTASREQVEPVVERMLAQADDDARRAEAADTVLGAMMRGEAEGLRRLLDAIAKPTTGPPLELVPAPERDS
jgi:hypothetical protein